ncbi:hypothetical protein [Nocardia implantans]|uniref:DUF3592 domain-containing protein n=1 Tax=Nocardia implantans TaxID=3108168 RepID=A0ABU6AM83_9NOCA|nr:MULTISPECIES: hypothetical protein [unclassified Nocardia]MBF6193476.1 hypothetical protein [Nocardia beijingensis]MEA3532612.1 hypothetical protein [Nocardia sp. CDC192]MEB3508576.1 hypothetical protein [Nocardia sp. CDC186]
MSQPSFPTSPSPVGSPATQPITPSGRWFALGGVLIGVGIIGGIILGAFGFLQTSGRIDDFQRVKVPGSGVVNLAESGGYTVYLEYSGASSRGPSGTVNLRVLDPEGKHAELRKYDATVTYSFGSHEGRAGFSFDAAKPGAYRVTTAGSSEVTVAIGQGLGSSFVGTLLGALALGFGGVVLGVLVIVVVAVKRSANRREGAGFPGQPVGY